MAQLIKCLLCKHEELSLIPVQRLSTEPYTCNHGAGEREVERGMQRLGDYLEGSVLGKEGHT